MEPLPGTSARTSSTRACEREAALDSGYGAGYDAQEVDLVRAAQRDPREFGPLYRRHAAAIARYLRRRLGDPHVVEDALSETFEQALSQLGRYRAHGIPLRAWLYRLANGCVHRTRRRAALRAMERLDVEPGDVREPESASAERARRARVALLGIAPRYQSALTLHYLEGLSVDEVAAICGCRPGTIKSRLARGRAALRRRLELEDEPA